MLKLITLLLTSSMTVMAGATIAPALPQIQEHFSQSPNSEFWVKLLLTLPALLTAISAPVAGAIIDRFGRKRLLAAAIAPYGLAGGSGLVLNTLPGLLVGRALLGAVGGGNYDHLDRADCRLFSGPKAQPGDGSTGGVYGLWRRGVSDAGRFFGGH